MITKELSALAMSDASDTLVRMKELEELLQQHVDAARAENDPYAEQLALMLSTQMKQADVSEWAPPSKTMAMYGIPDQPTQVGVTVGPEGTTTYIYLSDIKSRCIHE